jgi:hypothetical protein
MRALALFAAQILRSPRRPRLQFFSSCIVTSLWYAKEADDWAIVGNRQSFMCR